MAPTEEKLKCVKKIEICSYLKNRKATSRRHHEDKETIKNLEGRDNNGHGILEDMVCHRM